MMKRKPIFKKILVPLMVLVITEILILVSILFGQGLIQELNANEQDVLEGKVAARKNYLESIIVNDWMNMEPTVGEIRATVQNMLQNGQISLDTLDDGSSNSAELLTEISPSIIHMMRDNRLTGAYVILNTEELEETTKNGVYRNKPGVYFHDSDPTSLASEANEDILIETSPMQVVRQLRIPTASTWDLQFRFSAPELRLYRSLYYPFQTAYTEGGSYDWKDMGYWSNAYEKVDDTKKALSYSVPLVLDDGTVIGVLGADLSMSYLKKLMPYEELSDTEYGAYFLAQYSKGSDTFMQVFGNGKLDGLTSEDGIHYKADNSKYYIYMEPLHIYNSNTPFSGQNWVLCGMMPYDAMYGFSKDLVLAAALAVAFALVIGIAASLMISYRLQRPVARLAQELRSKDPHRMVQLNPTGILEIDQMSDAVEQLSSDVLESGSKFSKIIEMASVQMGGFQIDREKNSLFLTENFLAIFGIDNMDGREWTVEEFGDTIRGLQRYAIEQNEAADDYIFRIPADGKQQFISLRISDDGVVCYGLAEDVTQSLLEKELIKYERDHDSLTSLYNRRAFYRKVQQIFELPAEELGIAALVMIDLDNLKYINDTYGHGYGDLYIQQAASAISNTNSGNAAYARIAGDEFNVFFYGYQNREDIEAQIRQLEKTVNSGAIQLPDGKIQRVQATGGIAWYPDDSRSFYELAKYADYAMYMVKRKQKGNFQNFDKALFHSEDMQLYQNLTLTQIIENRSVQYALQPIVNVRTGEIFAYEALMRPNPETHFTVKDVMETARRDGKLNQIEELTWSLALAAFDQHIREGSIAADSYLFLNSIPSQSLSEDAKKILLDQFKHYGPQVVMELTEEEQLDSIVWEKKQTAHRMLGGKIALDDYGTGYNSEKTLLSISPDFIKVDLVIVRDAHLNADKRAIIEYIVNYAHTRGKYVIAEGIETEEEVRAIAALGVDYMQGYFFAKPEVTPQKISEKGKALLRELQTKNDW